MASIDLPAESPAASDASPRHTFIQAALVFCLLFSVYLLSYSGTFTSDDEQHLASGAQSFALTGQLVAPQVYGNPRLQGNFYEVDPGLPILGALVYRLIAPTPFGFIQALYLVNPFVTALTAVFVFLIGQQAGYSATLSLSAALLYGLGSLAWPYAGTFFRDPLAALFVTVAWYGYEAALLPARSPKARFLSAALAFVALLGGILSKNIVIPLLPVLAVAALIRLGWGRVPLIAVALFALLGLIFFLRPADSSQFRSSAAYFVWLQRWLTVIPHTGFWPALWGALLSPGKGLVVFAPFALLVPLGWLVAGRTAWQRLLTPSLWLLTLVAAQAFFYDYRWTNPQWGARFLLPVLPPLAVATLPALHYLWTLSPKLAKASIAACLSLGVLSQLPGVLVAPPTYSALLLAADRNAFYDGRAIWSLSDSAILGHWRLILSGTALAPAWLREAILDQWTLLIFLVLTGGGLLGSIALLRARPSAPRWRPIVLTLTLILIAPVFVLYAFRDDPAYYGGRNSYLPLVHYLDAHAQKSDLVTVRGYLDPFWYCYFNFGRPMQPWVGLPLFDAPANDAPPGDPFYLPPLRAQQADLALFTAAPQTHPHLWFIDSGTTPPATEGFDVESWLKSYRKLLDEPDFGTQIQVLLLSQ